MGLAFENRVQIAFQALQRRFAELVQRRDDSALVKIAHGRPLVSDVLDLVFRFFFAFGRRFILDHPPCCIDAADAEGDANAITMPPKMIENAASTMLGAICSCSITIARISTISSVLTALASSFA